MRPKGTWRWLAGLLLMLTILMTGERATLHAGPPPPSCHLRAFLLVEQDVITAEQRQVVRDEVARIWAPYGLAITWRTVPGEHVPGSVSIMIRDRFPNAPISGKYGGVSVAWTIFTETGPLPYIRASAAAARTVAASARVGGRDVVAMPETMQHQFVAQVLGRSIAHEIGHYLLGRGHADFGLMRAVIPPDDYFGARMNFVLTRADVSRLAQSPIWRACTVAASTSPAS